MIVNVPVAGLVPYSPFFNDVWECDSPIRKEEVQGALDEGLLLATYKTARRFREEHIQRIAFLVAHGWDDAIEIDVGVPERGYHNPWWILDGNHRLGAAIFRGDDQILAEISGSLEYALGIQLITQAQLEDFNHPRTLSEVLHRVDLEGTSRRSF